MSRARCLVKETCLFKDVLRHPGEEVWLSKEEYNPSVFDLVDPEEAVAKEFEQFFEESQEFDKLEAAEREAEQDDVLRTLLKERDDQLEKMRLEMEELKALKRELQSTKKPQADTPKK